jgi:uncharacterized membrane protein
MLAEATDAQWRSFLAVDVLQLIGTSLLLLQAMVMMARTRQVFTVASFLLGTAIIAASPAVWRIDWVPLAPLWVAAYLSPATGALFPLFPWLAYVLIGAGIGQIYARLGAAHLRAFASWGMLVPGAALVGLGVSVVHELPGETLIRIGACLAIIGVLAQVSRRITQLPHVFGAVAQESLTVYFVHLCIVYGSIWNPGLVRLYGGSLSLGATVLAALAVVGVMVALAWQWNRFKHSRPHAARWVTATVGVALVAWLL